MKLIFSISLFFLSISLFAQQKEFLHVPQKDKSFRAPVFASSFAEIFKQPETWKSITIFVEDLATAPAYDFSKLTNLELVQVQFSFSPDSSDAAKKKYTDKVNLLMKNMVSFAKCPKLKHVIFAIGEQIYLTKAQCEPVGNEEKHYSKLYKRTSAANKVQAWEAFGKDVNVLLPGVKLYAYTRSW
jgi:hypothetical protein